MLFLHDVESEGGPRPGLAGSRAASSLSTPGNKQTSKLILYIMKTILYKQIKYNM